MLSDAAYKMIVVGYLDDPDTRNMVADYLIGKLGLGVAPEASDEAIADALIATATPDDLDPQDLFTKAQEFSGEQYQAAKTGKAISWD